MKAYPLLATFLIISLLFFTAPFPKVHAAPAEVQYCSNSNASAQSINCTLSSNVTAGDVIVVSFGGNFVGGGTTTISGGGLTYTSQVAKASGNSGTQIYSAPDAAGGALTVTAATTGTANPIVIVVYDISGAEATAINTATGVCAFSCGTLNMNTASSISVTGTFAIASFFNGGGGPGITATNGFSAQSTNPATYYGQVGGGNVLIGTEWATSASGSTNFLVALSNQGTVWEEAAATFGPLVVVSSVVACTFFQLQCWWYPMLFFGVYSGCFLMVGAVGKTSSKGMTYLLLTSLTFGGLIQVQMGMLNIMFPLIFTFLTVLYMVRSR